MDQDAVAMDQDVVVIRFVEEFYRTFDANRADLGNFYQEESMLTFDGEKFQGKEVILAKLTSLPIQQCQHQIKSIDCQPSGLTGGFLIFVNGNVRLDGNQQALDFTQMFHLMPTPEGTPQGSFYVSHDVFRLNHEWRQGGHLGFSQCGTPLS